MFCIVLVSCNNNLKHEFRVPNVYKFSCHLSVLVCMDSFSCNDQLLFALSGKNHCTYMERSYGARKYAGCKMHGN